MIVFGYAKDYKYTSDGTMLVKVRIPDIHGPYKQSDSNGRRLRNYVKDEDLPYYQSIILPYLPQDGQIVALTSLSTSTDNDFIVLGITGGYYQAGQTNLI